MWTAPYTVPIDLFYDCSTAHYAYVAISMTLDYAMMTMQIPSKRTHHTRQVSWCYVADRLYSEARLLGQITFKDDVTYVCRQVFDGNKNLLGWHY